MRYNLLLVLISGTLDSVIGSTAKYTQVGTLQTKERIFATEKEPWRVRVEGSYHVRENCDDEFGDFDDESFDVARLIDAMKDVEYVRCRAPEDDEVFTYQDHYQLVQSNLIELDKKKQRLECKFIEIAEASEEEEDKEESESGVESKRKITLLRTGDKFDRASYNFYGKETLKSFGGSYFNMRVRMGNKINKNAQLTECLVLLDSFVKIQNRLNEIHYGQDIDESILLPEVSSLKKTEKKNGLEVGYILLIVFGALAALGGGYYAFHQYSNKSKKEARRVKRRKASDRDVTLKDREYDSDSRTVNQAASLIATNA